MKGIVSLFGKYSLIYTKKNKLRGKLTGTVTGELEQMGGGARFERNGKIQQLLKATNGRRLW